VRFVSRPFHFLYSSPTPSLIVSHSLTHSQQPCFWTTLQVQTREHTQIHTHIHTHAAHAHSARSLPWCSLALPLSMPLARPHTQKIVSLHVYMESHEVGSIQFCTIHHSSASLYKNTVYLFTTPFMCTKTMYNYLLHQSCVHAITRTCIYLVRHNPPRYYTILLHHCKCIYYVIRVDVQSHGMASVPLCTIYYFTTPHYYTTVPICTTPHMYTRDPTR